MIRLRHTFLFCLLSLLPIISKADIIIMREGTCQYGKVTLLSDDKVIFQPYTTENSKLLQKKSLGEPISIPTKSLYMVKFDKRGNVYINEEGKRITGENQKLPKDADIVYLTNYKELPAFNLNIDESKVSFLTQKADKKIIPIAETYPRENIFLIIYNDGSIEIITPMTIQEKEEETTLEPESEPEPAKPEYQVIFHTVKRGDTLNSIATEFNVTPDDLRDWNEINASIKPNSRLKPGMQLMIYVLQTSK